MSLTADLTSAVNRANDSGRRAVVILRDARLPAEAPIWHERLGGAHLLLTFTGAAASDPLTVAEDALEHIDLLERTPFVVGFGDAALAALHINAEGAALRAATVGGHHDGDPADPESAVGGPLLRIGGDADPDLPVSLLQSWALAQEDPSRIDVQILPGSLRTLVTGDGADAASGLVAAFFAAAGG